MGQGAGCALPSGSSTSWTLYLLWLDMVAGCAPWQDWCHSLVSAIGQGRKLDSVIAPGQVGALAELPECTGRATGWALQSGRLLSMLAVGQGHWPGSLTR